jgi:hypothetical protein
MDSSNQKWQFQIMARNNSTCSVTHLSKSSSTVNGHLNQKRTKERSTKIKKEINKVTTEWDLDYRIKTNCIYAAMINAGKIYTDQTGRFHTIYSKGNTYIMVLYEYDGNTILAEPIKNRTAPELLRAFQVMEKKLTARGLQTKLRRLNNEASQLLKSYLYDKIIAFQLVLPYSHRRNEAERAIRSFKDHLIAGICSTYKAFPMHLLGRLLPQEVITLNMLRISKIHPKLSASTHIDGQYDHNRAPMSPPGTRIIAHETPNRRRTWAPHGQDGWYIGPALEHYRCYTVYISNRISERVVETVDYPPTDVPLPFPSSKELATQAVKQLTHASLIPKPAGPFCQVGDEQMLALQQLAAIFEGALPARKKDTLSTL